MREPVNSSFLKRCGLTFDDLARVGHMMSSARKHPQHTHCGEPTVRMLADIRRSRPDRPHQAIARGDMRVIHVSILGELLSLADSECDPLQPNESRRHENVRACSTHYAVLSVPMNGASAFTMLADAPTKCQQCRFIPARGTIVVYQNRDGSPTALRAAGVDTIGGQTEAWTLDAFTV